MHFLGSRNRRAPPRIMGSWVVTDLKMWLATAFKNDWTPISFDPSKHIWTGRGFVSKEIWCVFPSPRSQKQLRRFVGRVGVQSFCFLFPLCHYYAVYQHSAEVLSSQSVRVSRVRGGSPLRSPTKFCVIRNLKWE